VAVDESVRVPMEFVKNGEIVLNVSALATNRLKIGNDTIEFQARFSGVPREVYVPIARVIAVYARENGQGMAFPVETAPGDADEVLPSAQDEHEDFAAHEAHEDVRDEPAEPAGSAPAKAADEGAKGGKGHLKIVK
jgi:stringent starvation protein B